MHPLAACQDRCGNRTEERPRPAEPNRRATLVDQISGCPGINDAMIGELVDTFYNRGRQDPLLAPVSAPTDAGSHGAVDKAATLRPLARAVTTDDC